MTAALYDNLTAADLDAIAARLAADPVPAREDAAALLAEVRRLRLALAFERRDRAELLESLRCIAASLDDLDPDAPVAYELMLWGLTHLYRRGGRR
jgi:hypothetical protein